MTVAVIIQARMGSTRLPGKVILPLPTGRSVLQEVHYRAGQIPGIDVIVVAIPHTKENDVLLDHVGDAIVVRGLEHDVLARYAKAAKEVRAQHIMRITADCPMIDPATCHSVLSAYYRHGADFATNNHPRTFPHGLDCEMFSWSALEQANLWAVEPYDREHVTPYLRRNYPICNVEMQIEDFSGHRWTLDTQEDYEHICDLFRVKMGIAA